MDRRRYLSNLAGRIDPVTKKAFKGVFTQSTLPFATNLLELGTPNLFFIELDDYFITIFNTPTKTYVLDPVTMNTMSKTVELFAKQLSNDIPLSTLSFVAVSKPFSLHFAMLVAVGLSSNLSLDNILKSFDLKPNNLSSNCEIVQNWFRSRYGFQ